MAPLPRPLGSRSTGWVRYNWWKLLVYLALGALGAVNLYPFVWMVGTSLKADAEAANERLSPVPGEKYRLADHFRLDAVLPLALEDGLGGTKPVAELAELKARLTAVIHGQNRIEIGRVRADAAEIDRLREQRKEINEAVAAKAAALERLRSKLELVKTLQADAWQATVTHRVRLVVEREAERPSATAAGDVLKSLIADGVLIADGARHSYWLSEGAHAGALPANLSPLEKRVADDLREYFGLTVKRYAQISKYPAGDARRAMAGLVSMGVLAPVGGNGDDLVCRLADGARGGGAALYPRQVLALWSIHDENVRRAESRATFAQEHRSPAEYAKETGLGAAGMRKQADAEMQALVDAGYLVSGRVLPINYWVVLKNENFLLHFLTSLIITVFVVFATIMLSSMLGYALARIRFPGKLLVFGVMIAAAILPGKARIIPIFKMLNAAGLMQNLWGMVLWMSSHGVGNALLMAGFFWTLPKEVDEAAAVDGAGVFRTYLDIAMPMARPIVMTVSLFAFLGAWNDFMVPLLCTISRPAMQPLAVAVYNFQQGHAGMFQQINAAAAIMIVPVILLFLLVQKHVVKAIAVGAVKG
jgi:raffinose/stachyose/melibiose transport system permease protein